MKKKPSEEKKPDKLDNDKKDDIIEEKKPLEDPQWWLLNAECEKCGRRYCDHESKY